MSSLIEVKHLKKYYNKGEIKALDDVSVNIERGDVMVVIGPSGSGDAAAVFEPAGAADGGRDRL